MTTSLSEIALLLLKIKICNERIMELHAYIPLMQRQTTHPVNETVREVVRDKLGQAVGLLEEAVKVFAPLAVEPTEAQQIVYLPKTRLVRGRNGKRFENSLESIARLGCTIYLGSFNDVMYKVALPPGWYSQGNDRGDEIWCFDESNKKRMCSHLVHSETEEPYITFFR